MYTVFNGALQPFCKDIHLSVHVLHFDFLLNVQRLKRSEEKCVRIFLVFVRIFFPFSFLKEEKLEPFSVCFLCVVI